MVNMAKKIISKAWLHNNPISFEEWLTILESHSMKCVMREKGEVHVKWRKKRGRRIRPKRVCFDYSVRKQNVENQ